MTADAWFSLIGLGLVLALAYMFAWYQAHVVEPFRRLNRIAHLRAARLGKACYKHRCIDGSSHFVWLVR